PRRRRPGGAVRAEPADRGTARAGVRTAATHPAGPHAPGHPLQHRPTAAARPGPALAGPDRRGQQAALGPPVLRGGSAHRTGARLMRIATWNVNSIRARIDRLTAWLDR